MPATTTKKKAKSKRLFTKEARHEAKADLTSAQASLKSALEELESMRGAFRRMPPVAHDELRLRLRCSIGIHQTLLHIERALLALTEAPDRA